MQQLQLLLFVELLVPMKIYYNGHAHDKYICIHHLEMISYLLNQPKIKKKIYKIKNYIIKIKKNKFKKLT